MFCEHCGSALPEGARFCGQCGQPVGDHSAAPAQRPAAPAKKVSARQKPETGTPHILLRLLFLLCAAILIVHTLGTLAVGICGESTRPTQVSFSFSKKEPNGGRNDFLWTLDYHYVVRGQEHSGFTTWHGTRWSPDSGHGKYQVNYLSFLPQISRFQRYDSLLHADTAKDVLLGGLSTLFSTAVGGAAAYLLLVLAIPGLPFFGSGKRKKAGKQTNKQHK